MIEGNQVRQGSYQKNKIVAHIEEKKIETGSTAKKFRIQELTKKRF